jgi:hypothetical protein
MRDERYLRPGSRPARVSAARLPHRFAKRHRTGDRHVERTQARSDRDQQARVGRRMHMVGDPGGLAAEQQDVIVPKRVLQVGDATAGGEQDQPGTLGLAPGLEIVPAAMANDRHLIEIVHSRAAEGAVGDRKAGWLDNMRLGAQAGGKTENRTGILRDVRLVKRDSHARDMVGNQGLKIDHSRAGLA